MPSKEKVIPTLTNSPTMVDERLSSPDAFSAASSADVIVAGALAIDLSCNFIDSTNSKNPVNLQMHTSNPATITQSLGGVGQNVATALHYLGTPVLLCSAIGDDVAGAAAKKMLANRGLSTSGIEIIRKGLSTAQYVAINSTQKDLFMAMADMRIMEEHADFEQVWQPHLNGCIPKWLVVDANWDKNVLHKWMALGKATGASIAYEPVSVTKSKRLFASSCRSEGTLGVIPRHNVNLATPNSLELASMHAAAREAELFDRDDWWEIVDAMGLSSQGSRDKLVAITNVSLVDAGVPQQSIQLLPFIPSIVTKLGHEGVLLTRLLRPNDARLTSPTSAPYILSRSFKDSKIIGGVYMRLFPPVENLSDDQVQNVNGVGDTFLGVLVAGLLKTGHPEIESLIDIAQKGSVMTLKSTESVSPEISNLRSLFGEV
jgi:pseudouridylate synthase / pseudouridine kinase